MELLFDNEFRGLIPPITTDERSGLECSLKCDGNREPIIIWKETRLLLDGHNRYDICVANNIPLKPALELSFPDRDAAKVWIIRNQLGRRNLAAYSRTVLALQLEELLRPAAKEAQAIHGNTAPGRVATVVPTLAPVLPAAERKVREQVASVARVSHGTVDKVKLIQAKSTSEQQAELTAGTKTINQVYVQIRRGEVKEALAAKVDWPTGKYRVIYADPPWKYGNTMVDTFKEQADHYTLMTVPEICALPVSDLAIDNAVLFLWATSPILEEAFDVINAWGFKYKSSFVWDKVGHVMGHYNSVRHEFLLVAVKGACQPDVATLHDSVVTIERTGHSVKPERFREIIDEIYPYGPRIELFARTKVKGWDVFGNQIGAAIVS